MKEAYQGLALTILFPIKRIRTIQAETTALSVNRVTSNSALLKIKKYFSTPRTTKEEGEE